MKTMLKQLFLLIILYFEHLVIANIDQHFWPKRQSLALVIEYICLDPNYFLSLDHSFMPKLNAFGQNKGLKMLLKRIFGRSNYP
jgi:hypothetical protein